MKGTAALCTALTDTERTSDLGLLRRGAGPAGPGRSSALVVVAACHVGPGSGDDRRYVSQDAPFFEGLITGNVVPGRSS